LMDLAADDTVASIAIVEMQQGDADHPGEDS
jgi:hypothetical protein